MKIPPPSRTVVLAAAAVLMVTVPGFGLAAAYAYAGDVPRGTTVLGADLGALGRDEAEERLRAHLEEHAEALAAPVPVRIDDAATEVDPEAVDLAVDVPATVARAAEQSAGLFGAMYGERTVEPVVEVDTEALDDALREVAEEASEAMTMPAVEFDGTDPVPVYPEPGLGLDPEESAAALTEGWPPPLTDSGSWREPEAVAVPMTEVHPVTTAEDVDRLVEELAEPAVAAPVTAAVRDDDGDDSAAASVDDFEVPPSAIAASLELTADSDGEIQPEVDPEALRDAMADTLEQVETEPSDAEITLRSGGPTVEESTDGVEVDLEALAEDLLPVLDEPDPREVTASATVAEPEFTTEDAEDLGVVEQVSSFTSDFPPGGLDLPRNYNISVVADEVDGALVMPGDTFSLNGYTGERSYAQGYVDAPVILDGRLQPAVGGGISQFATSLFNATYYAGLEDVEHNPHSYYYSRYPSVIESTIYYPGLDLKFRNNTEYGVLIDTSYSDQAVTVTLWSTAVWDDVTTEWGPRQDVTEPETRYLEPGDDCIDTSGIEGFYQEAWRIFHRDGEEVDRELFSWRYDAQPEFICGEEP